MTQYDWTTIEKKYFDFQYRLMCYEDNKCLYCCLNYDGCAKMVDQTTIEKKHLISNTKKKHFNYLPLLFEVL